MLKKIKQKFTLKKILKELGMLLILVIIFFLIQGWMKRNMVEGDAPNFERQLLDGSTVKLSDYRGKVLILHFWADWCPYCKFEESSISSLLESEQVITVAFQSGNNEAVQKFLLKQEISQWPTIVDNTSELSSKYGVSSVPATYFIDSNGVVRFRTRGITSSWGLRIRLWLTELLY
ncbi:MAG: redoxin domain-containing protein [Thiotrichaceae bacterium]|nr:redoxin domain-containing protein [Thiotrichaceae bacterium]